ncbi:MAG: hypothetical protein DRH12_06510 [Deltaproteobacteria bacterium]|nr:MAG: hypothetical protein DRH12_06510 [Deltaproteobacteria bacterium]
MKSIGNLGASDDQKGTVKCAECQHFSFFYNEKGHNSPQALGKCLAKSWDGNRGQWPLLIHPCESFLKKSK